MNPRFHVLCAVLFAATVRPGYAEVTVVRTFPLNGEHTVNPSTKFMRVRFSEPIQRGGYSFTESNLGRPVAFVMPVSYEDNDRIVVVGMNLKPSTTYWVSINSERFQRFRAAAPPNTPVTPYVISFTTAAAKVKAPKPAPKRPKTVSRTEAWREDIDFLARELPTHHANLFFALTRDQFHAKIARLKESVAASDDGALVAGIAALIASVKDSHTTVDVFGYGASRTLPAQWYTFKDGDFVVAAGSNYANLLGARLVSIGGVDFAEAKARIASFVPHDNDSVLRNNLPRYMTHTGLLRAAGIVRNESTVRLEVVRPDGKAAKVDVLPMSVAQSACERVALWFSPTESTAPIAWKHRREAYALEPLGNGKVLYFAYNQCVEDPTKPFAPFLTDLMERMRQLGTERLIIDLRQNGGGNSSLLDPLIEQLKKDTRINQPGHLFVLVGRRTFSSASMNVARLKTETRATLIGEPTGGSASHFGEIETITLPNFGLRITYSTKRFNTPGLPFGSIVPDILAESTSQDYSTGRDPALEACMKWSV